MIGNWWGYYRNSNLVHDTIFGNIGFREKNLINWWVKTYALEILSEFCADLPHLQVTKTFLHDKNYFFQKLFCKITFLSFFGEGNSFLSYKKFNLQKSFWKKKIFIVQKSFFNLQKRLFLSKFSYFHRNFRTNPENE